MRLCEKESESESGGEVIYIVEGISFNFLFSSPSPSFLLFFLSSVLSTPVFIRPSSLVMDVQSDF